MKNIAVFASGAGSNAMALIEHFNQKASKVARVAIVLTNNPDAPVLQHARDAGVKAQLLDPADYNNGETLTDILFDEAIDLIVLAGYIKRIPEELIEAFPNAIINIHPSLLPKYGGKGMYGLYVHEAVVENGEKVSGITIHYVNEEYDQGEIIQQVQLPVNPKWTSAQLQQHILRLEHQHLPLTVEKICARMK
ncbi:MAG: phosphoribosylglycinamide formyltransferase [Bacteroidetes bacterium]|nr:phosphoribosylglycinamide formyltransferase [Bacteroidota bacterium]